MDEVRGEKVVFRRKDIVPLHDLPSAQAHEPIVLHAVDASRTNICMRLVAVTITLFLLIGAILVGLVEMGTFDSTLNARAVAALIVSGTLKRLSPTCTVSKWLPAGRSVGTRKLSALAEPR